ncbi:putative topoisomerase IV subunit A [Hollandina sp. SP2]
METAVKAGRIKIQSVNDFTTEQVEIEIRLARGVYAEETVNALFAFTECEQSISVNLLVIQHNLPVVMTITQILQYHAQQIQKLLTKELEIEKKDLQDKLHLRTLERIFIEQQIYQAIEKMKTPEGIETAVIQGFKPFMKEVGSRGLSAGDVEHLLRIPIRRISLYDTAKVKAELLAITARIKEIHKHLKGIVPYAVGFIEDTMAKIRANEELGKGQRKTEVHTFTKVAVKEAVKKDRDLKYDRVQGYLGTAIGGELIATVSPFDRILILRHNGTYTVLAELPEKTFIGPGAWWIGLADKEALAALVFTVIYKEAKTGYPWIKRCIIEGWIMNKAYSLVPEGAVVLHVDTRQQFTFTAYYAPKPRIKTPKRFKAQDYPVKGIKAGGMKLTDRIIERIEVK